MKKELMSFMETERAVGNIRSIELSLGHEIPPGVIDVTSLGDRSLGFMETERIVSNIRNYEITKKAHDESVPGIIDYIFIVATVGYILAAVIMSIFD